jgi:hypothetical protein
MSENSTSKGDRFVLLRKKDEITVVDTKTKEEQKIVNLYSLKWSPAGPVAKLQIDLEKSLANPDAYWWAARSKTLFSFNEARKTIVEWFINRGATINDMKEDDYINMPDMDQLWKKYLLESGQETLDLLDAMNEDDLGGGRG